LDLLSNVDAHSAEVVKKVYCTTTSGDDAKLGKYLYEALFGKPVMWPSEEALEATGTAVGSLPDAWQLVEFQAAAQGDSGEEEEEDFALNEADLLPEGWNPIFDIEPDEQREEGEQKVNQEALQDERAAKKRHKDQSDKQTKQGNEGQKDKKDTKGKKDKGGRDKKEGQEDSKGTEKRGARSAR